MKSAVSFAALLAVASASALPKADMDPAPINGIHIRQAGAIRNDLKTGPCKPITVIFARGTTEAGNVGSIAGPPFFNALGSVAAIQGVDYPADIAGFLVGGDRAGSATMAQLVSLAASKCPDTKIVMSGYSQGGQLVHNAADQLSATLTNQVNSVVIFGDPDNGDPVGRIPASRVKIICHVGDNICQGGALVLAPHLTYGQDAAAAAAFVRQQAGV